MSAALNRKLGEAQKRLQKGDVAGAQVLCQEVLARAPQNPDALGMFGLTHLMTGRAREAVGPFERALCTAPHHPMALENLGLAHLMLGEFAEAERPLRSAARLPGATALSFMRLGAAILHQGRHAEAVDSLSRALELDPRNADIHLNLGQAADLMGDPALARRHFETALQLNPNHADATYNLGVLSLAQDQLDAARGWFERAIGQSPLHVDAHVNLGIALQKAERLDAALASFKRALELNPELAQARSNAANVLMLQGKPEVAREEYLTALRIRPGLIEAREGLAAASFALGRFKEAIASWRDVVRAEPDNGRAVSALADALLEVGELAEAESTARRANELDATAVSAYSVLAEIHLIRGELDRAVSTFKTAVEYTGASSMLGKLTFGLRRLCEWDKWRTTWPRMASALESSAAVVTPFSLLCEPTTPAQQLAYTRRWCETHFKTVMPGNAIAEHAARTDRRLRIGYLSSDFYEHAVAYLVAEVLELHDREHFEVTAYSYGPDDHSPMHARLRAACEHCVDLAREPDDLAARRIQDDQLDILIDLKGHTMGARTSLLARRLCPIQVNWLGYPGTMGAAFMDYIIADHFLIAPAQESVYAERVLRMPHCYQPNDRQRAVAPTLARSRYGLPDDAFVFCCFNQAYKITPDVFAVWMRLMHATPASVLWLLEDNRWAASNLKAAAAVHGIAPDRLIFAPKVPLALHLARYRAADLALDTFPYTSHTTASDALWCDCLLVALCGDTFAGRVSGSILSACGLPELIAYSLADYERLVLRISTDNVLRDSLRTKLAANRLNTPLFDSLKFTRDLETIYRDIAGKVRG